MITIHKSPTADTRTCDYSKVTKEQLRQSSIAFQQFGLHGLVVSIPQRLKD